MDSFKSLCISLVKDGKVTPEGLLLQLTQMFPIKPIPAIFSRYGGELSLRPIVYEYGNTKNVRINLADRTHLASIYPDFREWITRVKYPYSTGALELHNNLAPLYRKLVSRSLGIHEKVKKSLRIIDKHLEKKEFGDINQPNDINPTMINEKILKKFSEQCIREIRQNMVKDWDIDIPSSKESESLDIYLKDKKGIEKQYSEWSDHDYYPVLIKYCLENSNKYIEEYADQVARVYFSSSWIEFVDLPVACRYEISLVTDEDTDEVSECPIFV